MEILMLQINGDDQRRSFKIGVLSIALLCIFLVSCTKSYSIPDSYDRVKHKVATSNIDVYEKFADIQTRFPQIQDGNTTVVVALSGGGLRAANFSIGSLLALEQIPFGKSNLLNEVDYISSVSGGGLAAGAYVAGILSKDCQTRSEFVLKKYLSENKKIVESLGAGFLENGNFFKLINPKLWFTTLDRGDALQDTISKQYFTLPNFIEDCGNTVSKSKEVRLGHIFVPSSQSSTVVPTTPYLIANSTNRTNGEIVSFTPAHLENTGISCYTHRMKKQAIDEGFYHELPLAVGIRSSASFPVGIVPATYDIESRSESDNPEYCKSLNSASNWQHLHLTDGGVSDNLGVNTALDILNFEHKKWLSKTEPDERQNNPHTFLLIIVDAYNGSNSATTHRESGPGIISDFLKSTNLPLSSFRVLTKGSLRAINQDKLSVIDAISGKTDVNVAYVHMDALSKHYRSVGTVGATAFGVNPGKQADLIASGMLRTFDVFGLKSHQLTTGSVLSEIGLTSESYDLSDVVDERYQKTDADKIVRFDKFKRRALRTRLVEQTSSQVDGLSEAVTQLEKALGEHLYANIKFTNSQAESRALANLNKEFVAVLDNSSVAFDGVPINDEMLVHLQKEIDDGYIRVDKFLKDIENSVELEVGAREELGLLVSIHSKNLTELQTTLLSLKATVPNDNQFLNLIGMAKALDAENNMIEARTGAEGIKKHEFGRGNYYWGDPEYAVGAERVQLAHAQETKREQKIVLDLNAKFIEERIEYQENVETTQADLKKQLVDQIDGIPEMPVFDLVRNQQIGLSSIKMEQQPYLNIPNDLNHLSDECPLILEHLELANNKISGAAIKEYYVAQLYDNDPHKLPIADTLNCRNDESVGNACQSVFRAINSVTASRQSLIDTIESQIDEWPQMTSKSVLTIDELREQGEISLGGCSL